LRADRSNARVYSLSGLLRCYHCGERMRVVRTENGRVRYHCRSKAQGLGCSGKGSLLDVYEVQVVGDLERFALPAQWKAAMLAAAAREETGTATAEERRRQLQARRERLRELYAWGELTAASFRAQCAAIDAELAHLAPGEAQADVLDKLVQYIEHLPAAWGDADPARRNQLASIIYEEVWVDGPRVVCVKPRPEIEPLFQVRTGAAQPIAAPPGALSHANVGKGDPDGSRGRTSENFFRLVVRSRPPVAGLSRRLLVPSRRAVPATVWPIVAARVARGESLRALGREYGVSRECIRRIVLKGGG
jgi:hypothetical protein